jgi:hypothetical protein
MSVDPAQSPIQSFGSVIRRTACAVALLMLWPAQSVLAQTTRDASNFAELQAAVTASAASGDTIGRLKNQVQRGCGLYSVP